MSKFHSTVSRRDFMKGLGLAGAGLGAAAASAPVFHDLDELTSSKGSHPEMRWWINERDFGDFTTPVDWSIIEPYDRVANPMPPFFGTPNPEELLQGEVDTDGLVKATPGRSIRDAAFSTGSSFIGPNAPWDGPSASLPNGAPGPWSGTPEENMQTMRAAIHSYGCKTVGAMEIDDKAKKLMNKGGIVWDSSLDSLEGYRDETTREYHIPTKCRYMLSMAIKQNAIQGLFSLSQHPDDPEKYFPTIPLGGQAVGQAYSHAAQIKYMTMRFIKSLGYAAYSTGVSANAALGVASGLGEQGRPSYLCSPEYGLSLRYTTYIITDLPLAPTKPIDGGIVAFCKVCGRCSDTCPSGACSQEDDISFETAGEWNRPGFKGWHMDWLTCCSFGSPMTCGACQVVCPFNHPEESPIHSIVRGVAGTTSLLNGFFSNMDRLVGYGKPKSDEALTGWWDRDLNNWKYDSLLGFGQSVW